MQPEDMNRNHNDRFRKMNDENMMRATVNNDDIFWCTDIDRDNRETYNQN